MPVDEYFGDGVVVTDATTVVDTDALVVAAVRLREEAGRAHALEAMVGAARDLVLRRAAAVPVESAWALGTLAQARTELAELARSCSALAERLASSVLVYAAAEGDARGFMRIWGLVRPDEASGWNAGMSGPRGGFPWILAPAWGLATLPVLVPSVLAPGVTWVRAAGVVRGQVAQFRNPDAADGTEGLRLQMDVEALSRILVAETWSWGTAVGNTVESGTRTWWGVHNTKAPEAASELSAWALGIGRLMRGPTSGVEVASASATPVIEVVPSDARATSVAGPILPGFSPGGSLLGLAALVGAVPVRQSGDPRRGGVPVGAGPAAGSGGGSRLGARPTSTPRSGAQLLARISDLDSSDSRGQVEVLRHTTPTPGGGRTTSWSVVIRGTQRWDVGGANPQDMLSNFQGIAGEESDQVRAVRTSMEMAGIQQGDVVEFTGHSQGGIVAAQMAADPEVARAYRVSSVLTAGAPVAGAPVGAHVDMLNLENTGDPVPALDGSANADLGRSTTVHFDGRHVQVPGESSGLGPHALGIYREAVEWMEQDGPGRPSEVAAWAARREAAMGFTERTITTAQLFDTHRVGPS